MAEIAVRDKKEGSAKRARQSVLRKWLEIAAYLAVTTLFIAIITLFTLVRSSIKTYKIPTGAMEPTLRGARNYGRGDKIIVIRFMYGIRIPFTDRKVLAMDEPDRGDVIVFKTKGIDSLNQDKDFIKRLVGLGGEKLQIVPDNPNWKPEEGKVSEGKGHIYVDGKRLESPEFAADRAYYPNGKYGRGEIRVPEDHYYMLGDNSINSRDSRYWGFVPRENVIGKAVAIYWPPGRAGLIR
jgi:signal peptidase I